MLSDPVSWLDVLVLLAAYLVASLLHKGVTALLRARDTFDEITTETGDEVAPDSQDEGSADTTRAVCTPATSSPLDRLDREHVVRGRD